jgi:hypothetical protein
VSVNHSVCAIKNDRKIDREVTQQMIMEWVFNFYFICVCNSDIQNKGIWFLFYSIHKSDKIQQGTIYNDNLSLHSPPTISKSPSS